MKTLAEMVEGATDPALRNRCAGPMVKVASELIEHPDGGRGLAALTTHRCDRCWALVTTVLGVARTVDHGLWPAPRGVTFRDGDVRELN